VLVAQMDLALSDLWVAWGLVGLLLSLGLGATLIRATNAELRRLAADPGLDTPRWPAMQRRVATVYGSNLLLLLSVLWAMVFKPTLCPSRDRRSAAARRSPSLPATPRASCCWLGCCSANATWNKVRRPGRRTP
jgi:hypothetical protein